MNTACSGCGEQIEAHRIGKQRYCLGCHASRMRRYRANTDISPAQRVKANARSYANTYKRRGKIVRKPCEMCGGKAEEMHHEDYDKPLEIMWLCKKCHRKRHVTG